MAHEVTLINMSTSWFTLSAWSSVYLKKDMMSLMHQSARPQADNAFPVSKTQRTHDVVENSQQIAAWNVLVSGQTMSGLFFTSPFFLLHLCFFLEYLSLRGRYTQGCLYIYRQMSPHQLQSCSETGGGTKE